MSKETEQVKSSSVKLWETIEMIRHRDGLRQRDLAEAVGVSTNTVSLDANCPERIPQGRLWRYLAAVGVSDEEIIACLAKYLSPQ